MLNPILRRLLPACVLALAACASVAQPAAQPLHDTVQTLTQGYRFVEGPALAPDGSIYFSDIPARRIVRYDPATGHTADFTTDSGGANGLMFQGHDLYACETRRRRVGVYRRVTADPAADPAAGDAQPQSQSQPRSHPLAATIGGVPFNKPNDLAIDAAGGIYFTDPNFGDADHPRPPVEGVYYLPAHAASPDDSAACVIDNLIRPNGVALNPAGDTLYAQDVGTNHIYAYDVLAPGKLGPQRLFADVSDLDGGGRPDGLTVDTRGNVYTALFRAGAIVVHRADGHRLQVVPTGPKTTNCVLDADEQWLYVTADQSLKRIKLTDPATR